MKKIFQLLLAVLLLSACADKMQERDRHLRDELIAFINENARYHQQQFRLDSVYIFRVDSLTEKQAAQLVAQCIEARIDSMKEEIAKVHKDSVSEQEEWQMLVDHGTDTNRANEITKIREFRKLNRHTISKWENHIAEYSRSADSMTDIISHADASRPYALYSRVIVYATAKEGEHTSIRPFFVLPYKGEPQMFFDYLP